MFRVVLITVFLHFAAPQVCSPGTFLYTIIHTGEYFCIECQDGTFMLNKDRQQTLCRPCEKIKDPELEILVSPCNKTHDAVIHCVDGFYRELARNPRETGQCRKCTECSKFTGQACSTYRDAVCCWDENFDVVPDQNGVPSCRERPWFCRRGQYFNRKGFQCLPCPDNTFMSLDYHVQPECWDCREYDKYESDRPLHSIVIQPCNSTHAPVIRCEDGFYTNPKMSYRDDAVGCSQCTDCSTTDVQYEGRKCDGMEDTVCCPQPNMTVVDTSDGPVCLALSDGELYITRLYSDIDCGKGDCQHYNVRKKSTRCAPCKSSGDIGVTDIPSRPTELKHETAKVPRDTKNSERPGIQMQSFQIGLAIGVVATLVLLIILLIIYMKYLRQHAVFKVLEAKIRLFYGTLMANQHGDRDLDDEDVEALQPLTAPIENLQTQPPLLDDGEVEMTFGRDDDLREKKEKCKKFSNHSKFTQVMDFTAGKLPDDYLHLGKSEYIKAICDLTVRIRVQHISKDRPENDPYLKFAGLAGTGLNRCGSGLVFQMIKEYGEVENQRCPCVYCQAIPQSSRKSWAEFLVVTSAQLVFDDTECRHSSCRLRFDEDKEGFRAPSLTGTKVNILKEKDICKMYCVIHYREESEKLKYTINSLKELRNKYQLTPSTPSVDQFTKALVISHPHGLSKRISVGNATAKMDGQALKWTIDAQTCPGSLGAPVCLTRDEQSPEIWTTIYTGGNECKRYDLNLPM